TGSSTPVAVTNLSVTIVTGGRPVRVFIQNDGSGNRSTVVSTAATFGNTPNSSVYFLRGATTLSVEGTGSLCAISSSSPATTTASPSSGQTYTTTVTTTSTAAMSTSVPASAFQYTDIVAAGTYTYSIQVAGSLFSATNTAVNNAVLVAYET
ncbi:MAG: hypothetical protein ABSB69_20200, partial [Solirubrobacteraceae bacterium]